MDEQLTKKRRWIGAWKLVVGLILVGSYLRVLLTQERDYPAALQYANETERIAGNATQFVTFLAGVVLIFLWIRSIWARPKEAVHKGTSRDKSDS